MDRDRSPQPSRENPSLFSPRPLPTYVERSCNLSKGFPAR